MCIYMIPTIKLTYPSPHIATFLCVYVVRTLKIYCLSKFQVYNTAWLPCYTLNPQTLLTL